MIDTKPILSQGYGYGYALGLGTAFALIMMALSKMMAKFMNEKQNSERFSTASRSVGSGLIASSTVSAWTWPATLLTSGAWAYTYGLAGPFMYGIGGTIQIILFVFLAIEIKRNSPGCHTVAQLIYVRFGKAGHICYLCYCIATNVLVSSLLLLGGSQGFALTTGMHVTAASFLLPTGVCIYTLFGGLKATFISDWIHTVIIYIIICISCFTIYTTSTHIGSPGKMWDLLQEVEKVFPSASEGNFLSFKSRDMILTSWSVMLGGLSSVFGDPGYSQHAIASDPKGLFSGYVMGGVCWFVVPWALGTSAGLASRALLTNAISVTYPRELTSLEINGGMPVIYGLKAIFGLKGAAAGLLMLFMSVTSATSAELIAFSSITTYDVFQTYIKPKAGGKLLVKFAHCSVIFFSLLMAVLSIVFNYIGVTSGWLLGFIGIILSPEVAALVMAIYWKKMSRQSLLFGAPFGTLTGISCWLGSSYHFGGKVINKNTLMAPEATFIGNATAIGSTILYIVIITLIKPENFDFEIFLRSFKAGDDASASDRKAMEISVQDKKLLRKQSILVILLNLLVIGGAYIITPLSLYATGFTFTKKYFTQWVIIMMIWLVFASGYILAFPLWQGRFALLKIVKSLFKKNHESSEEGILIEGLVTYTKDEEYVIVKEVPIH